MSRRTSLLLIIIGLLALAVGVRAGGGLLWSKLLALHGVQPAASTKVISTAWPSTPAGSLARGWVAAFNAGEAEMRRFLAGNMAERTLKERSIDERIATYTDLRSRYGTLKLKGITRSEEAQIDARLSGGDGTVRTFAFEAEPKPPHKLISIRISEHRQHHGR